MTGIPDKHSTRRSRLCGKEILLTRIAIFLTITASFLLAAWLTRACIYELLEGDYAAAAEDLILSGAVFFFIYGNLVYQFTRIGYLKRAFTHRPASQEKLARFYDGCAPTLTMLIPSYKEEPRIIRQAILSAALQEYEDKKVVLLIDDPPDPADQNNLSALLASRRLPGDVQNLLKGQAVRLRASLAAFMDGRTEGFIMSEECRRLAALHLEVAAWFDDQISHFHIEDHTDRWFVRKILREPSIRHSERAEELLSMAERGDLPPDETMALREYRKLAALFDAEITSFERKKYINLSHEPNKAMNLNSYIGLMGKSFRETKSHGLTHLEETCGDRADLFVSGTDYLITLDADSLLIPEYASRLIDLMERPGNERLAVVQTPYNAIPGSSVVLERVAGATTDIQYVIHQGFTQHSATFWVGANALLRKTALDDICTEAEERGFRVPRYIQDRTVIEDTESTIDLIERGWKLFNYPERLSYSATPPDFGALLIQRRRWANGGLIILPKLLRYLFKDSRVHRRLKEGFYRIHYLTSLAGVNMGLLIILLYPLKLDLPTVVFLLLLFAVNSFIYCRDLIHSGYGADDLLRIYALNLMLIPINLGGVFKSLHQALTGEKIPFGRTPKVKGRTGAPALYIMAEFGLLLLSVVSTIGNAAFGRWLYAAFALVNTVFFLYIVKSFIGLDESLEDLGTWWAESTLRRQVLRLEGYRVLLKGLPVFRSLL